MIQINAITTTIAIIIKIEIIIFFIKTIVQHMFYKSFDTLLNYLETDFE